jgi:hypothetical protein
LAIITSGLCGSTRFAGRVPTFDHRWPDDNAVFINFRDRMRYYADKIKAAYDEADEQKSLSLWREVFGDEFGKAE